MVLPLTIVLVAGLLVLGMVCMERFLVHSWPSRIRNVVRNSQEVRLEEQDVEVEVMPQEISLSDLMTREGPATYTGTEGFEGPVGVVGRAMDAAERTRGPTDSRRRARAHKPATGGLSQPQS